MGRLDGKAALITGGDTGIRKDALPLLKKELRS
jgi:hypothetical protein